jgi:hypothetical protein
MEQAWSIDPQDRPSATSLLVTVKNTEIALQLSPQNETMRVAIINALGASKFQEISKETCLAFNATPTGPKYTCGLFNNSGMPCMIDLWRYDHVVYHLQEHLGVTPYMCADSNYLTSLPKWYAATYVSEAY